MADDITLTPQELEDIRNDERFKERTTLSLKYLSKKVEKVDSLPCDVHAQKMKDFSSRITSMERVVIGVVVVGIVLGIWIKVVMAQ